MRLDHPSFLRVLALVLVLATPLVAAPPLAYRVPAGDAFELVTVVNADAPMVGHVTATIQSRTSVLALDSEGMKVEQSIVSHVSGKPDYSLALGMRISPQGRCSDVTGLDPKSPRDALVARNASMGLPTLPDEAVAVGATWQDERPIYLPKLPIPGVPEVVRLQGTYKVTSVGRQGDRDTVTIAMSTAAAPGEKANVSASGTFVVDAATGRPLGGHLKGEASIRVILKTIRVPFVVEISAR